MKELSVPRTDLGDSSTSCCWRSCASDTDAYGIPILDEVCARSGREVSRATVYVALKRLEQKRLVTSRLGESTPERGGRAKRFFKIKPAGLKALRESHAMFQRVWRDYEAILERA